jgi:hypothetical protein
MRRRIKIQSYSLDSLWRNQVTKDKHIEAMMAVQKLAISKPGTILLVRYNKATLMKKADIPSVKTEIGKAII